MSKTDPRVRLEAVPFDGHFCPRVLSDNVMASRFGVVQTLLNDDAFWTNPTRTCKTEHQWHDELQCKHQYEVPPRPAARSHPPVHRKPPRPRRARPRHRHPP